MNNGVLWRGIVRHLFIAASHWLMGTDTRINCIRRITYILHGSFSIHALSKN